MDVMGRRMKAVACRGHYYLTFASATGFGDWAWRGDKRILTLGEERNAQRDGHEGLRDRVAVSGNAQRGISGFGLDQAGKAPIRMNAAAREKPSVR